MIFFKLFLTFFKIGAFSFGGGYAMIPLIQGDIVNINGWLTETEFTDIIAIAEMTPGPIAVNSATFVGYKTAGVFGGVISTVGVALPSLILAMLISRFFFKYQKHPINISIFYGIRPVIAALIMTAAVAFSQMCIFTEKFSSEMFTKLVKAPLEIIDLPSVLIFIATIIALVKFKIHPILVILGCSVVGIIVFSFIQ